MLLTLSSPSTAKLSAKQLPEKYREFEASSRSDGRMKGCVMTLSVLTATIIPAIEIDGNLRPLGAHPSRMSESQTSGPQPFRFSKQK